MLDPVALDAAIVALDNARRERRPVAAAALPPLDWDEALEVQEAFAARGGGRVAGYKIGCSSAEAQAMLGAKGPFPGRVFAAACFASPATVSRRDFFHVGVEAEFALELGRALPARAA